MPPGARLRALERQAVQVTAYARWAAPGNRKPFTEIARAALRDLQASAAILGADAVTGTK
jgi:uncharacterized protein YbjQ (UPF0145 family)